MLEFRVLGPFTVLRDGSAVDIGGVRRRAFLAVLALNAGRVVSTARIADQIWDGAPPRTAVHGLEVHASNLRKVLGRDVLRARAPGYVLVVEPDAVDANQFQQLAIRAHEALTGGDAATASRLLAEAERLWHGDVLADISDADFARGEARRLEEIHLAARELAAEAELVLGVAPVTIARLREAASAHPYRERSQALLVRALAAAGRQADALDTYNDARRRLVDNLGIEPGPELRAAQAAVLQQHTAAPIPALLPVAPRRESIVAVAGATAGLALPVTVADAIATASGRDLVFAGAIERAADGPSDLGPIAAACAELRAGLRTRARTAAFTTCDPPREIAEFAQEQEAELLVVALDEWGLGNGPAPTPIAELLTTATMDVALVHGHLLQAGDAAVAVPFGGAVHDWAAAEVGAHIARASGVAVRLIGIGGRREDASRILANVALALQRSCDVDAEPVLARRGAEGVLAATFGCGAIVMGLSDRWRAEGLGPTRSALIEAIPTAVVVRRGARPRVLGAGEVRRQLAWSTPAHHAAVPVG